MSESAMYNAGHEAYFQGKPVTENPHPYDTEECREWERGWFAASAQEIADAYDFAYDEPLENDDEVDGLDLELEMDDAECETDDAEREIDDCDFKKDFDIAFRVGGK